MINATRETTENIFFMLDIAMGLSFTGCKLIQNSIKNFLSSPHSIYLSNIWICFQQSVFTVWEREKRDLINWIIEFDYSSVFLFYFEKLQLYTHDH